MKRSRTILALTAGAALALGSFAIAAEPLSVGAAVPDFSLFDENGKEHKLSQYAGKMVVLEWTNPDCPYVKDQYEANTMEKLSKELGAKDVVWLAVNSTSSNTPEDTKKWRSEQGFEYATLQDKDGKVGKMFGAKTTPHMYVLDTSHKLRYAGAIDDNDSIGKPATVNYVESAAQKLFSGAAPNPSDTKPYGCSVKYAN
jgi:peroxiredoxin